MDIKWLGHSCFIITSGDGHTLLTDPYDPSAYPDSLFYHAVEATPDVVTISHDHADHGNLEAISGTPEIVRSTLDRKASGFQIKGIASHHDQSIGAERGDNIIFRFSADGISACHLGDLGHELEAEQVEAIGEVEVLFLPVGGKFTIDSAMATRVWQQLLPRITIPMHFRNEKCLFLPDGVEGFLSGKPDVEQPGVSEISVDRDSMPAGKKIIVLEPAN